MVEELGSILGKGFETWKDNLSICLPFVLSSVLTSIVAIIIMGGAILAAIPSLPSLIPLLTTPGEITPELIPQLMPQILQNIGIIIVAVIITVILVMLIGAFFIAGAIGMAKEATETGRTSISDMMDYGRRKFISLLFTDIIVGFPTETDEQFQHTIDLLKTVKPDITNVTRYSSRPHTKAKVMKGRVRTDVAKERSKILTKLCIESSKENNRRHVGRKYTVLITEKGKNNAVIGRTENYKPVVIREKAEMGKITPVIITDAAPTYLFGRLI